MRYLGSITKFILFLLLFLLLLGFALKNTEMVTVRYFLGGEWGAPLCLVLLLFFGVGAALGVAAALSMMYRQRRELASLRKVLDSSSRVRRQGQQPDASLL